MILDSPLTQNRPFGSFGSLGSLGSFGTFGRIFLPDFVTSSILAQEVVLRMWSDGQCATLFHLRLMDNLIYAQIKHFKNDTCFRQFFLRNEPNIGVTGHDGFPTVSFASDTCSDGFPDARKALTE
jgi:hypothetical protein